MIDLVSSLFYMKRTLIIPIALFLAACTNISGLSAESSRPPAGNPNGIVIVEEFSDLQCPACRAAHSTVVAPILEKYGTQIQFKFNHFPLRSIHRFALDAAEASECAADQGKFWEFVDLAYEKQADLNFDALLEWGDELGLDTDLYERCWKSHIKRDVVLDGYKEGRKRNVGGTPSFFVQGKSVGANDLDAAIGEALKGNTMPL